MDREETQAIASLVRKIEEQLIELRGAEIANTLAVRALLDAHPDTDALRASIASDLGDAWPTNPRAASEERSLRAAVRKTLTQLGCSLPH